MAESIFTNPPRTDEKCVRCNMGTFYLKYPYATGMGHIYSPKGKSEFLITGFCEWCFDEVTDIDHIIESEVNE